MPAVLALAPLLIAALVLLIAIAGWFLAELLARLLDNAPLVGGVLAGWVRGAAGAVLTGVLHDFDALTADAGWLFAAISRWVWNLLDAQSRATAHAISLGATAIANLNQAEANLQHNINSVYADAMAAAHTAFTDAYGLLQIVQGALQNNINHAYSDLLGLEQDFFNRAEADMHANVTALQNNINALQQLVTGQITALQQAVTGDVGSLETKIASDLTAAEAAAEAAVAAATAAANAFATQVATATAGTAIAGLDQAAHDVILAPWTALLPELGSIAGGLAPDVAAGLGIAGVLTEPVPVSIPGILSLVVPALGAVTAEVGECLVPNCDAINRWRHLLDGMTDAGLWALLLALVVEAAHDPAAAADDIAGGFAAIVTPISAGMRDLFGVG